MSKNKQHESGDKSASYQRGKRGAEINNNQNEMKDMGTMEDESLLAPDRDNYFDKK